MVFSGFGIRGLDGLSEVLRAGWLAVDVFVVLSGFVIFYLLEKQRETYLPYILRRFFRLWPLFIILFAISIPLSLIHGDNAAALNETFDNIQGAGDRLEAIDLWWRHIYAHVVLHTVVLHGVVPDSVLPGASTAFLPFHIEYFTIGMVSYYCYKKMQTKIHPSAFILTLCASILIYLSANSRDVLPFLIWVCVFSLLVSRAQESLSSRMALGFLESRTSMFLGKVSYSIYLSHWLIIIAIQRFIFSNFPDLSREAHFMLLLVLAMGFTIICSAFLYRYVELPGIRLGNAIKSKLVS